MLIIEGPDEVGKTTLANKLVDLLKAEGYPATYGHMSKPNEHFDYYEHYLAQVKPFLVQDRFHYGALIWGNYLGFHKTKLTPGIFRLLEAELTLRGVFRLVITVDTKYLQKRLKVGKGQMFDDNSIIKASLAYNNIGLTHSQIINEETYTFDVNRYVWLNEKYPFVTDEEARDVCKQYIEHLKLCYSRISLSMYTDCLQKSGNMIEEVENRAGEIPF